VTDLLKDKNILVLKVELFIYLIVI